MKHLLIAIPLIFLSSCSESNDTNLITKEGIAELIHFSTGPSSSTLLTHEAYKGKVEEKATYTLKWRNPTIKLDGSYIEISYPGTDRPDQVIPRESLLELQWKVDQTQWILTKMKGNKNAEQGDALDQIGASMRSFSLTITLTKSQSSLSRSVEWSWTFS